MIVSLTKKNKTATQEIPSAIATNLHHGSNNLNINLPDNNAVLRLEVELRDKNARRRPNNRYKGFVGDGRNRAASPVGGAVHQTPPNLNNFFIPMEKVSISLIVLHSSFFFLSLFVFYSNLKAQRICFSSSVKFVLAQNNTFYPKSLNLTKIQS